MAGNGTTDDDAVADDDDDDDDMARCTLEVIDIHVHVACTTTCLCTIKLYNSTGQYEYYKYLRI